MYVWLMHLHVHVPLNYLAELDSEPCKRFGDFRVICSCLKTESVKFLFRSV